ncbi:hypothetical protein [Streptomyces sp. WMMB 714]|nr:hypothetical protein [Streptomyces sp. WMMB 714]
MTPSVHLADNYRGVLVGVGRTVTFTDPSPGHAEPEEGSVAHAVRSDFG